MPDPMMAPPAMPDPLMAPPPAPDPMLAPPPPPVVRSHRRLRRSIPLHRRRTRHAAGTRDAAGLISRAR